MNAGEIQEAQKSRLSHTFMNILQDLFSMTDLRCWEWMNCVSQVRYGGLAHLLLMSDGDNRELPSLLLH